MYILTTLLLILFGVGSIFGFYVVLALILGDREKWEFLYIFSLLLLFLIISQIMPKDYKNPFKKGKPTMEDIKRGYNPDSDIDQDFFKY